VELNTGITKKLNDPLVVGGSVEPDFQISLDSSRVVYRADQDTDEQFELYSSIIDATGSTKLNSPLVGPFNDVDSFRISADSGRVVYLADQDLFSAVIHATGSIKLNDPLDSNGDVQPDFQISQDSSRVVYRADQDTNGIFELYSAAIDATGSIKLNDALVSTASDVLSFQISQDSSRVVYRADQDTNGIFELYSAAIEATGSIKLNDALVHPSADVNIFQISQDSSRVIYIADQDAAFVNELYSAAIDATGSTKLNDALVSGGNVFSFQISADSNRVVYGATQDVTNATEIYSAEISATGSTKLNDALLFNRGVRDFQISADSSRVIYRANQDNEGGVELYSAAINATGSKKLNNTLVAFGDVQPGFQISPDSGRVIYVADQDTNGVFELYSSAISATGATKLNDTPVNDGDILDFKISSDSSRVIYLADQDSDSVNELYTAATDATGSTKLNNALELTGDDVTSFAVSPNGRFVVYIADQDTEFVDELYSVEITSGVVTKLNSTLVDEGNVVEFGISADSNRVVYRADEDTDHRFELFSTAIDANGSTKLNERLRINGNVFSFKISADSSHVVYRAQPDSFGPIELYSSAIDATGWSKLNDTLACCSVGDFQISADGSHVVYLAPDTPGINELYSVPINGTASTKLNGALVSGGDVDSFLVTADSSRVIYLADQDIDEKTELYSTAINTSGATKLNDSLVAGGNVLEFQISGDSSRVVYRADQDTDEQFEIYSAEIDSTGATKLNDALISANSDILEFQISGDSSHVVYRSNQDSASAVELYSAAIDSTGSTRLSVVGAQPEFRISPDSGRVVYRASPNTVTELFSSEINSTGSTKLNNPLVQFGGVFDFRMSPNGNDVVYRAIQDTGGVTELYSAAISRSGSTKLNAPLVNGGDVLEFQISPGSGGAVIYRADQEIDMQAGLFVGGRSFEVNSTSDASDTEQGDGFCDDGFGHCTLRAAIQEANSLGNIAGGLDEICFNISGAGPHVIQPSSPLPNLTDPIIIDGTSQPGFDAITHFPVIEIDGSMAGSGANGLTISGGGGGSTIRGLAINRFDAHGVFVSRRDNVMVEHTYIGTDPTGTIDHGNGEAGIYIINGEGNVVRHSVISGNDQFGVKIEGVLSTDNVVAGNMIGTDAGGGAELKNRLTNVDIAGAPGNTIGGSAADARNVIGGGKRGVAIRGSAATGNMVFGNRIGTNADGTAAIGITRGVEIVDGVGNTIGGPAGAANLISGNSKGIEINRGSDNLVHGNFIGTDAAGVAELANIRGVLIRGGINNQIGNEPNVISGNVREGVKIFGSTATGNVIRDNFIGTNTDGDTAIPNRDGVVIRAGASGNTVGGSNPGEGNLISGNTEAGVFIFADDNDVIGNMIGVDVAGVVSIPNETGVLIHRSAGNQIGGAAAGAGNIISGNSDEGILITGAGASGNQIEGNLVGTDVTAGMAIGNKHGIVIEALANSVGGDAEGAGNVISGNIQNGVYLRGGAVGNTIHGNQIGTDASGTIAVANGRSGVLVEDARGNTIGGTAATVGNMIGGNDQQGVKITGVGATGNILQGNTIGLHTLSGIAVPNRDGVRISDRASGNTIGGAVSGAANIIAHNSSRGVWINDGIQNLVSGNSFHQNGALGLDLGPSGLTVNDANDQDGGANLRQNFPVIESVLLVGPELDVRYSNSSSAANSSYPIVVEFFLADSAGQEGELFLDSHTVNAPGTTTASIAADDTAVGQRIVATATDSQGNTSEFSAAAVIDGPMVQITELPDYGVDGFISGVVSGVDPATHVVAPYIQIEGAGWWTKPTFGAPTVPIDPDGTFSADVAAPGTLDNRATIFAAAVIPVGNTPPQAQGTARIPSALDTMAVAIDTVERFGRTFEFAGRTWGIKEAPLPVGPGNNRFSDEQTDVFVDQDGLHLTVNFHDGEWWATEVVLLDELGYGTYSFQTNSEVDDLDVHMTFGAFTWDPYGDDESGASQHREIDFEDGRWGNASDPTNAQTVVQPFDTPGNLHRYTIPDLSSDPALTRFFTWRKDQIEFTVLRGHHTPSNFAAEDIIHQNTFLHDATASHFVPAMGRESFRFNLWIIGGQTEPADGQSVEVVVNDFNFTPLNPMGQPLLAESVPAHRAAARLEEDRLALVVGAAHDRLGNLKGTSADPFSNVKFAIADLPGAMLGLATGNSITIDINAAGHGWFIDDTPFDDTEFDRSAPNSIGGMDLLTVVMHEFGHVAGLRDLYDDEFEDDLMYGWLEPGIRKTSMSASSLADEVFARV
jgi:CSLREA domain-containing protein